MLVSRHRVAQRIAPLNAPTVALPDAAPSSDPRPSLEAPRDDVASVTPAPAPDTTSRRRPGRR